MKTIGVIDYGMGNLHSVINALEFIGVPVFVSSDKNELEKSSALILPGVGAFGDASKILSDTGLDSFIVSQAEKKPLLGICLGMQLLFEYSQEFGYHRGLGLIKGGVIKLAANEKSVDFRIPHMGWNKLVITPNSAGCPLLQNVADGSFVYFVHSYKACAGKDNLVAYTEYGEIISAVVQNKAVYGTQFHPEKSEEVGLEILRSFFKSV